MMMVLLLMSNSGGGDGVRVARQTLGERENEGRTLR